jgi:photosystem II stability/assembly factor-like uncharacterized protein
MLLLLTTSAFAQWQFAYNQDLSYTFYSVHFPSSTVGYIVGSGGIIYKTIDGGSTWTQQTSPTTNTLNKVFFTDDTHGFAVGDAGTIIYTADGTNWSVHAQSGVITTRSLATVWFVGSDGWIAGGATSVKCEIYKTTNGGTTWANVTVTNPSVDYCTDISFYDANLGYASVDRNGIMYTTDGGINWTKSVLNLGPYPYTRTDIECVRATGPTSAVAGGWGSLVGPQPTILIVSTNSGANFNCPNTSYPWATYTYGYGLAEFGDGDVVLMGGGAASAGITIHSTDLSTWTRLPAFYWGTIRGCGAVPGTNRIVAVGEQGLIALSTDRGTTWTYPFNPGTFLQGFCDMDGVGANKVFAAGVGSAYFQIDASTGAVKPGVISPNNWGAEIQDIDYVVNPWVPGTGGTWGTQYDDVMYAAGKNGYFCKSIDAGKTWTEIDHSASNFSIYFSMHWFDPDSGVVVGCRDDGANHRKEYIWRTTDGGATLNAVWTPQLAGTNNEWNSVAFAPDNPAIGVVTGDDRYVAYTSDRGYHWTLGTTNIVTTTIDIDNVVMINSTTAYAVGENGTLIKTTDAGHTWQVQTVPWLATLQLWRIAYDTPNRLWVTGPDQMCYYTTNGGTSWTSIPVTLIAPTYDVKSVYYQGAAGILWVGTEYGRILKRTDQPVTGTETPKTLPFVLNQNYPNPFNPSTTIQFAIANDGHVGLNVYDVTGRLVATVMNKDLKAGTYTVGFKADKLATGVYFYKLTTSKGEETRKMVVIR